MTDTTITMTTGANAIGVFLHYPGDGDAVPLPDVQRGWTDDLGPGVYAIAASGTGNLPGTPVQFEFKTDVNAITRKRRVRADGTLRAWITFELAVGGKVS